MTTQISLKRLAEIKEAVIALRQSDVPARVKRMRERLLREEADYIAIQEKLVPPNPDLCSRCQEISHINGSEFCYPCIVHYLDALPRWVISSAVEQEWADIIVAKLMKVLLDNNLIGIPE
jgi:hypothetical protein